MTTEFEKPLVKLVGQDGNVYNLIGIAKKALKRHGLHDQYEELWDRFEEMKGDGSSYNDVLCLILEYVDVDWDDTANYDNDGYDDDDNDDDEW